MAGKRKPPVPATGGGQAKERSLDRDLPAAPSVPSVTVEPLPEPKVAPQIETEESQEAAKAPRQKRAPKAKKHDDAAEARTAARTNVLSFPAAKERRVRSGAGLRKHWRLWTSLAAIVVVVALLMLAVFFSPLLALKTITVDGAKLASADQVQSALASLKGKPLPRIDQSEVQKLLTGLVQVQSVTVEARPPSTLLVHLVERIPVAVLKNGEQYVLVDPQGIQLGTVADAAAAQLPLIDGGTGVIGQATFSAITAVLAALPTEVRAQMASASASSPDAVELTLVDGKKVTWGDASQMALKAKVLQTMLKNPPQAEPGKPALAPIKFYDVSAPKHPVTR